MAVCSSIRRGGTRLRLSLVILAGMALPGQLARGQPVEEAQFKAAVVFNLTKFVEWPASAFKSPTDPITICILGESPIGSALEQAVKGKRVEERKLVLRSVSDSRQATNCQLLFVPSGRSRWRSLLADLKSSGVLTVGEADDFAAGGGMVNLKTDDARVRIQVNLQATEPTGIKIRSNLLSLAQIVK